MSTAERRKRERERRRESILMAAVSVCAERGIRDRFSSDK